MGQNDSSASATSHSQQYPPSARPRGRIFAVGDVHGCAVELESLIVKINPQSDDLIVFLGDYVDRGPESRQVIDLVLALAKRCQVVALKGNHEAMFCDFLDRPESSGAGAFVLNGGAATLAQYMTEEGAIEVPEAHLNFLRTLKLTHETEDFFFVHAGVPDVPLKDLNPAEHELIFLWTRTPFLRSKFKWEKLVIHGHTPVQHAEILPNRVNVDTGCVYNGKLTAIELPSMRLIQVQRGETASEPLYPREKSSARISMRFSGRLPVRARRGTDPERTYETLNYNQFGILMKELNPEDDDALTVGDAIEGAIGGDEASAIRFAGTVVRCESRGGTVVYGVRIERVSGEGGGPTWIERPTE